MSRALLALALGFAIGGGPPLQWAEGLIKLVLSVSASTEEGNFDSSGGQSNSDYGNSFDPNG